MKIHRLSASAANARGFLLASKSKTPRFKASSFLCIVRGAFPILASDDTSTISNWSQSNFRRPAFTPLQEQPFKNALWSILATAFSVSLRELPALVAAVPVRLIKRDFVFIVEHLCLQLKERRIEVLARNRGIKKA